jgi:hypothetical protein
MKDLWIWKERPLDMERKTCGYRKRELGIWNERPVNIERKTSDRNGRPVKMVRSLPLVAIERRLSSLVRRA